MTTASAVAPNTSYCSSLEMMSRGTISETSGRLPAMKMTEPNSPSARAKASAKPVSSAGPMAGKITLTKVCQPEAHKQVMALGALEFIKKPCTAEEIRSLLERLHLLQEGESTQEPQQESMNLTVEARDVYQELANVAMGQAGDLLARMLGGFVILPIPNVNVLEVSELHMALGSASRADTLSAVCQGFIGAGIAGEALILFHDSSFADLAKLMKHSGELNRGVELELLMDMSNVLIGAFLRGFANQLDTPFSQGHPVVLGQHSSIEALISTNQHRWKRTLAIEINYRIRDHKVQCDLLLLFTEDSIQYMNNKILHLL